MTDGAIWQMSTCELAATITRGDVSCVEAVSSVVNRVAETNGKVNAIVTDLGERALTQAIEHDRLLQAGSAMGPLHGVPVTIKINVDQEGEATSNGVVGFKDMLAPDDSPVVRNLKNAGAIVVGRTNTPEFSFRATTDNELYGRTFNPWNDWASAGGSSGGAGAAVMMGYGPIGHGNDIGGSLRFPAACCGAVTVKPGYSRRRRFREDQCLDAAEAIEKVVGVMAQELWMRQETGEG